MVANQMSASDANGHSNTSNNVLLDNLDYLNWKSELLYESCNILFEGMPNLVVEFENNLITTDNTGFWPYVNQDKEKNRKKFINLTKKWERNIIKKVFSNIENKIKNCKNLNNKFDISEYSYNKICRSDKWNNVEVPTDNEEIRDLVYEIFFKKENDEGKFLPDNFINIICLIELNVLEIAKSSWEGTKNDKTK